MEVKNVDGVLCMVVEDDLEVPCETLVRLSHITCGESLLTKSLQGIRVRNIVVSKGDVETERPSFEAPAKEGETEQAGANKDSRSGTLL